MPAVRSALRQPWYALAIITAMAVCSALLTTVLALVDGVLFKPLGYPAAHDLYSVNLYSAGHDRQGVGGADLDAWAEATPGLVLTGYRAQAGVGYVTPNFFDVFGVRPALGGFAPDDFSGPWPTVAPYLLMPDVFKTEFGADPDVIGRTVVTDPSTGAGYRIVGVMPATFRFPSDGHKVRYLTPMVETRWSATALDRVVARLPGASAAETLAARVQTMTRTRNADRPGNNSANHPIARVAVVPLSRALGAAVRPLFMALLAAAGVLVVIGALNASSLLSARCVDRHREFAIRRALGAGRRQIGTLLLREALLLLGLGSAVGVLLSAPVLAAVAALIPDDVALFRDAAIDWRVISFSLVITVALAAIVIIWPLVIAGASPGGPGHERGTSGPARSTGARLVIAAQVSLAFVLVVGGALLVGSVLSVYAKHPAISTDQVLTIEVEFTGMSTTVGRDAPDRGERVDALLQRVRAVPGVDLASLTAYDMLQGAYGQAGFQPPRRVTGRAGAMVLHAVSSDFYRTVEPHLVEGRLPSADEERSAAPVMVVSELLARTYWPTGTAVGQTVDNFWPGRDKTRMTFTIVGVVKDVPWARWDEAPTGTYYGPYRLLARQVRTTLLIKSRRADPPFTAELRRVITEADPGAVIDRVMPLEAAFTDSVRPRRFRAWLFGSFAVAGLTVVGLGIFGQLAMSTARRTREVGVRMALGATRVAVARLIVREQLWPVLAGLLAGVVTAAWATRFVASYLYEVTSTDPRIWITAVALIGAAAAAGTLMPALRASRVNPNDALRADGGT